MENIYGLDSWLSDKMMKIFLWRKGGWKELRKKHTCL